MGRTAGLKQDGTLDSVHSHSGTEYKEGTLKARTVTPDYLMEGDSQAQIDIKERL